jgi:hypothetical protein
MLLVCRLYSQPFLVNSRFNCLPVPGLPFGGIGPSGCVFIAEIPATDCLYVPSPAGYHTGKYSFEMFTHLRSTLDHPSLFVPFFSLAGGWHLILLY